MNDPRLPQPSNRPVITPTGQHAPHVHRPMPGHAAGPQIVDPLVETSHSVSGHHAPAKQESVRMLEDEPIELVADETDAAPNSAAAILGKSPSSGEGKRIVAFGGEHKQFTEQWKRQTTKSGTGACRVKSFHGKYSDEGLRYLDHAINQWLDDHPDIEVKFVTPTVMTFEGKVREPALVLNVWY
ncbi:MAG: hypothetical protein QM770_18900 [Tepidisphaeraceae bacterium]